MIRANLKAGGSIQQDGSVIAVTVSGTNLIVNNVPADAQAVLVYTDVSDNYGSNFVYMGMLNDPTNPLVEKHSGSYGAISGVTYTSNTLTITLASLTIAGMTLKAVPLKVA